MLRSLVLLSLLLQFSPLQYVHADQPPASGVDAIVDSLKKGMPSITAEQIRKSAAPGLYEVVVGPTTGYVTADGKYFVSGDLIDVQTLTNLTEERRKHERLAAIAAIDTEDTIVFAPEHPRHTITVFTDVDCPYCRKLHGEIAKYNEAGIAVRYLAFPRSGPGTLSWLAMEAVWCSPDRKEALTRAKLGDKVTRPAECRSRRAILNEYLLANRFGIQGTPGMVFEDGTMMAGYVSAKELAETLDKPAAAKTPGAPVARQ
jgi:thiol:disulfide interchange protein DsbC